MKTFLSFVDRVYCINLDTRNDRWQEVVARFEELGIVSSVTRMPAVVNEDPRIGCRHSHVQCIEDAVSNNYENILIFEDDVLFMEKNKPNFDELIEFLSNDDKWDLFYLGGSPMFPASFLTKHVFKSRFFSTHAYLVNKRAFLKIKEAETPIDYWYSFNTVSYGLFPIYAVQGESFSDIRKEELSNIQDSMTRRYDKLVGPNIVIRWWNYLYIHYLSRLL